MVQECVPYRYFCPGETVYPHLFAANITEVQLALQSWIIELQLSSPESPLQRSVSRCILHVYITVTVSFSDEPLHNVEMTLTVEVGGGVHDTINY